jgi:tetratricopeptide (TPR) repeat protein
VAKNIIRKELKQPDQFVSFWTRLSADAQRVVAARRKPVLMGVGLLAGLVTAALIVGAMRERSAVRSSEVLARVEKIATADLVTDGASKDDGVPHFKTDKERLEAALNEVDSFLNAERRSPLRPEALLQKAGFLLDLQRADEAIPIYSELLSSRLPSNLRFLAQEGLGYAKEAKGDLDGALAAFTALAPPDDDNREKTDKGAASKERPALFYQDRSLYHRGRIAERKGNPAEAVKLYREVLDRSPQTGLRDEISNRLAVLEPK